MDEMSVIVSQAYFNIKIKVNDLLKNRFVTVLNFETIKGFICPDTFKLIFTTEDEVEEIIINLKIIDKNYCPHYIGYKFDSTKVKMEVIAINENIVHLKGQRRIPINYKINYQYSSDGGNGRTNYNKPTNILNTKNHKDVFEVSK